MLVSVVGMPTAAAALSRKWWWGICPICRMPHVRWLHAEAVRHRAWVAWRGARFGLALRSLTSSVILTSSP